MIIKQLDKLLNMYKYVDNLNHLSSVSFQNMGITNPYYSIRLYCRHSHVHHDSARSCTPAVLAHAPKSAHDIPSIGAVIP
jgi:hypothetical protein